MADAILLPMQTVASLALFASATVTLLLDTEGHTLVMTATLEADPSDLAEATLIAEAMLPPGEPLRCEEVYQPSADCYVIYLPPVSYLPVAS